MAGALRTHLQDVNSAVEHEVYFNLVSGDRHADRDVEEAPHRLIRPGHPLRFRLEELSLDVHAEGNARVSRYGVIQIDRDGALKISVICVGEQPDARPVEHGEDATSTRLTPGTPDTARRNASRASGEVSSLVIARVGMPARFASACRLRMSGLRPDCEMVMRTLSRR